MGPVFVSAKQAWTRIAIRQNTLNQSFERMDDHEALEDHFSVIAHIWSHNRLSPYQNKRVFRL